MSTPNLPPSCSCSKPAFETLEFAPPPGRDGVAVVLQVCKVCGCLRGSTPRPATPDGSSLLAPLNDALARGASEVELIKILGQPHFEAGMLFGAVQAARQMAEKVTYKGRLKRLRILFPFDTPEALDEVRDLLFLGTGDPDPHGP